MGADRLEPHVRLGRDRLRELQHGRRARLDPRCAPARGWSRRRPRGRGSTSTATAPEALRDSSARPAPSPQTRACTGAGPWRASSARSARADRPSRWSAEAPPATTGFAADLIRRAPSRRAGRTPSAGRGRTRRAGTQPRACRAARRRSRRAAAPARRTGRLERSAPDRVGRGRVADQAERFGGAALDERRRIAERRDERIAGALVADEPSANAAICRTSGRDR